MKKTKELEESFQKALRTGYEGLAQLEKDLQHIEEKQEALLMDILSENKETKFGQQHHFTDLHSFDDYCEKIPLRRYKDYRPYVREMLELGRKNVLFSDDTFWYAITSGTTGHNKFIPLSRKSIQQFGDYFFFRALALTDRKHVEETGEHIPSGHFLPLLGGSEFLTPEFGESCGSIAAGNIKLWKEHYNPLALPSGDLLIHAPGDLELSPYIYLRYSLPCQDMVFIVSIYDDFVLHIFHYLEKNWMTLCNDIEKGILGKDAKITPEQKANYEKNFVPMPERARELREIFQTGFEADSHTLKSDTLKRIWPQLQLISVAAKAERSANKRGLIDYLEGINYDNSPYGASESIMGVSADLGSDKLILLPDACVFEFLPADTDGNETDAYRYEYLDQFTVGNSNRQERPLRLHELLPGHTYELIITTRSGLYRYRIGDLMEVVDKIGDCPLLQFRSRKGVVLNLANEKTTENALRQAISVAAVKCHLSLKGYSVYGVAGLEHEGKHILPHYVVQFEGTTPLASDRKSAFATEIEKQLFRTNEFYGLERREKHLGKLALEEVGKGSYEKYDKKQRSQSPSPEQYKRPLYLKL